MRNKRNIIHLLVVLTLASMTLSCNQGKEPVEETPPETDSITYDAALAAAYGADDYGMKKYVFAFLYRGDSSSADSAQAMELQMKHLENIRRMAEEGKLVMAGPFFGDQELRGIYIFNVASIEEAEALTNTDPAIEEGVLRMELMEWYGAAALVGLNELNQKVTKKSITE